MKFVVLEVDHVVNDELTAGRIAGPYTMEQAVSKADDLANEAANRLDDVGVEELDTLDYQNVYGDSAHISAAVGLEDEEVYVAYIVKELYNI